LIVFNRDITAFSKEISSCTIVLHCLQCFDAVGLVAGRAFGL